MDRDEVPESAAELATLYEKYSPLVGHTEMMGIRPLTGEVMNMTMSTTTAKGSFGTWARGRGGRHA